MSEFEDFVKLELPLRPITENNEAEETILVRRGQGPRVYVALDINEGEVIGKSGGVLTGITGGGADLTYVHNQSVASATWDITHNLGKKPSITIVDSSDDEVEGDVTYVDNNTVQLNFSAAFSGKAYLN